MHDFLGTFSVHLRALDFNKFSTDLLSFPSALKLTPNATPQALSIILLPVPFLLWHALYHLYLSPLARARIPGPTLAAALPFDLWLTVHGTLRLRKCRIIHGLFDTYGPVVRVGPGTVVFKDLEGSKVVYGGSLPVSAGARGKGGGGLRFEKSSYYKSMVT